MKKRNRILSVLTAAVCGLSCLTVMPHIARTQEAAASEIIHNPFIWSDVPDDDIIRVGDTYYMVHTTMFFAPGVPVMKSKDLFSWEMCNYVYDTYADGPKQTLSGNDHDYAHGQWATSLRYHDGKFYVFFGSYGTGNSYIYTTDDIENGKWTRTELRGMYHDASMLFDTDGRKYLVYGGGEIKIKEFNDDMTGFKNGGMDKTLFKTNLSGLAGEGSHIHKVGDWYYVFIIAWPNGHPRTEYVWRSKSLNGNWEGKVVLESGLGTYGSGVAQGGIIDTPDGNWYALLFQDHGAVGRIPVLVPFKWQNDWPVMGENGKAPVNLVVPDGYKGTKMADSDDFSYDSNKLNLLWQWNHNPDNKAWSVTEREGYLRLHNEHIAKELLHARNTLTMRTEGPSCSSVVKLDTSGMKPGDHAGLSAFQFNYGNVGVYIGDDGSRKVYMARNGGSAIAQSSTKIIQQENMEGKEIYLKIDFQFNNVDGNFNVGNNIDKANFFYSYDGSNWKKIGETLGMTYDLKLFTGYRSGLYSYPTKTTGGYADFDFFQYERAEWNVPQVIEPDADGNWFHYTYEKGTEGFSGRGGATVASVSGGYESDKALACTGREASWHGAQHSLSSAICKPGEKYSFSVCAKYDEGDTDTDTFHFTLQYTGSDGEVHYDKIATETVKKGEWVQLANTSYQIPEGASGMTIYVETAESTNSFFIDEMICAPDGTKIAGPGATVVEPEPEVLAGDIDGDEKITAKDMTLAKSIIFEDLLDTGTALTTEQKAARRAADVTGDGKVSVEDIVWYAKYLTGQTAELPAK